jgi:hypothetical protein
MAIGFVLGVSPKILGVKIYKLELCKMHHIAQGRESHLVDQAAVVVVLEEVYGEHLDHGVQPPLSHGQAEPGGKA